MDQSDLHHSTPKLVSVFLSLWAYCFGVPLKSPLSHARCVCDALRWQFSTWWSQNILTQLNTPKRHVCNLKCYQQETLLSLTKVFVSFLLKSKSYYEQSKVLPYVINNYYNKLIISPKRLFAEMTANPRLCNYFLGIRYNIKNNSMSFLTCRSSLRKEAELLLRPFLTCWPLSRFGTLSRDINTSCLEFEGEGPERVNSNLSRPAGRGKRSLQEAESSLPVLPMWIKKRQLGVFLGGGDVARGASARQLGPGFEPPP